MRRQMGGHVRPGSAVRVQRFKLSIMDASPAVGPVDSQRDASWQEMKAAFASGKLESHFGRAYSPLRAPTFELYDLNRRPRELKQPGR